MEGQTNLSKLLIEMKPTLNAGEYVFISLKNISEIDRDHILCEFKEREGTTLILDRKYANELNLKYDFVASWISLMVHSSLKAVGLTAAVSIALTQNNISCNIIAGYFHDHIFVDVKDSEEAIKVLNDLSINYKE